MAGWYSDSLMWYKMVAGDIGFSDFKDLGFFKEIFSTSAFFFSNFQ